MEWRNIEVKIEEIENEHYEQKFLLQAIRDSISIFFDVASDFDVIGY